jgi:heat-inducible transcriptional repressor
MGSGRFLWRPNAPMAFYIFMESYLLSDREHNVLDAVVRNYILSAAPTSSRFLSKQAQFDLSAASIRNIMSDLEERGFITQPHTSAGRVPTDKGYRYYVDRLMKLIELPEEVKKSIKESLIGSEPSDLHLLMEATSKALSRVTHQLGVILAPKLSSGIFRHLYIFPIDNQRVLLHLTIDAGFVKTMICELTTEISPDRLARACEVINSRFFGMTLQDMCEQDGGIFSDVESFELGIIRLFVPSIKKILRDEKTDSIYAEGETNIMTQPEFFSRDRVSAIIEILEEKKLLLHMFETESSKKSGVVIVIGGENQDGQLKSFSIIKTNYQVGNMVGSLGVIGPKRMPYPFLVSAVDYTANLLSDLYSK